MAEPKFAHAQGLCFENRVERGQEAAVKQINILPTTITFITTLRTVSMLAPCAFAQREESHCAGNHQARYKKMRHSKNILSNGSAGSLGGGFSTPSSGTSNASA
ncbi:MAG: hypothetical protein Q7U50_02320 [Candidatus Nitrotoga sp.]|nr:hypothetical protein [Candidatus Nitrotoga sp.]MDP3498051.1 hypothetical protein [Candidatus Nitrotoga sp.]